jgi:ribosomal protein L11 methyltransferase
MAVPDVDWVSRFRDGFRPFACGPFWIAPHWRRPRKARGDRVPLLVDPGRAFGTGTHESTRLCLRLLPELCGSAPRRVLDLGTGSGILAVAAALLGCGPVFAVDVDPECTASAARHARLNRVGVHVMQGDLGAALPFASFDLVLANLSHDLIQARAVEIARLAAPGGVLALSGLLAEEAPALAALFAAWGRVDVTRDGEWAALSVRLSA